MNIFSHFQNKIKKIATDILGFPDIWLNKITAEPPKNASYGEISTNAAMVLCKKAKMSPRVLAEKIALVLANDDEILSVEIAGAGFINICLNPIIWQNELIKILKLGTDYGTGNAAANINIEFVSANPTGPLHIGHARGAVIGDSLANLLIKAGNKITKEYYINDAGGQINVLTESVILRYKEALGEDIGEIPDGLYPANYLIPIGCNLAKKYGKNQPTNKIIAEFSINAIMDIIRSDLVDMGIKYDIFFSEKTLHESGKIDKTLAELQNKGLIYKGILEPPKGKLPDDWEEREQLLFKTKDFGDDMDRPLIKSNGSKTYFAADVAYLRDKLERKYDKLIMILGADHGGYIARMKAACFALSGEKDKLSIHLSQLVKLLDNGKPIKMSKRAGNFTTSKDVVKAVGKDVLRFIMLTRKPEQSLDFDLTKVMEQSKDNPVFYVQYAHARCKSLRRMAKDIAPNTIDKPDFTLLIDDAEMALIRLLANYPRIIEMAAENFEPHRIAFYLQDVATEFHGLWNKNIRFIDTENIPLTTARLGLADCVATVIKSALQILGVTAVDEM